MRIHLRGQPIYALCGKMRLHFLGILLNILGFWHRNTWLICLLNLNKGFVCWCLDEVLDAASLPRQFIFLENFFSASFFFALAEGGAPFGSLSNWLRALKRFVYCLAIRLHLLLEPLLEYLVKAGAHVRELEVRTGRRV